MAWALSSFRKCVCRGVYMKTSQKLARKRIFRKIFLCGVLLLAVLTAGNGTLYLFSMQPGLKIKYQQENRKIGMYSASQGNYLSLSRENGIRQFPFVCGGRVSLLSLPDAKIYPVADTKRFLEGFASPAVKGDYVYFFQSWDSAKTGTLLCKNIRKNSGSQKVAEHVNNYVLQGDELFYINGRDNALYCKNLKTNQETRLLSMDDALQNFQLEAEGDMLYVFGDEERILYALNLKNGKAEKSLFFKPKGKEILRIQPLSDKSILAATKQFGILEYNWKSQTARTLVSPGDLGQVFKQNGQRYDFCTKEEFVYYYDRNFVLHQYNRQTKQTERLIDWSGTDIISKWMKEPSRVSAAFCYCADYIAADITYENKLGGYSRAIAAFDYDGKLVVEKKI